MSNRRRPRTPTPTEWLDQHTGHELPNACDDCTAYARMQREAQGFWMLRVFHDDTCPTYRAMRRSA